MADPVDTDSGIKNLSQDVRRYVETRLELFILNLSEQLTSILADSIQRIVGILMTAGGVFFLWFAFCYFISDLVGNVALGFLIGSLPLLIGGFAFMKTKPKSITRKIQSSMVQEVLKSLDNMENRNGRRKKDREEAAASDAKTD